MDAGSLLVGWRALMRAHRCAGYGTSNMIDHEAAEPQTSSEAISSPMRAGLSRRSSSAIDVVLQPTVRPSLDIID
jgi:hypothetical protein